MKASSIRVQPLGPIVKDVRVGRVAVTLMLSIVLLLLALHVPPFMPAGADPADRGQRDYAGR